MESLDIETIWDNDIAKAFCIAITDCDDTKFLQIDVDDLDTSKIVEFMLDNCNKSIYYVHNLTFEIFVFLKTLISMNIKFKIISSNKSVYSATIYWKNKKINMRCSFKLTMLSLKKLAELSGVDDKGVFPYEVLNKNIKEVIKVEENQFNSKEEYVIFVKKHGEFVNIFKILKDYCINDAKITKKSIIKYWKIIEDEGFVRSKRILTAAKLSVENYFKDYKMIKRKISIKHDRIIRKGYFGGRTEVFGNPRDDEICLHYDWQGMYAQCMSEKVLGGEVVESSYIYNLENPGFYWIRFEQEMELPILPIKKEKLLFSNGVFEGWYWFEEILLAIELGVKVIKIEKMITCQYYDYFITDFVKKNNKIREISSIHKQIGKNNNNTFYGRLGMNPERLEEEIITNIEVDEKVNKYEKIVTNNGIIMGYYKKEKSISNVLVSASITSKARIKLYKGMVEVIKKGGRILYTDTDSIIAAFKKEKYDDVIDKQIGEVLFDSKKEDTVLIDCVFAMPKTYAALYKNGNEIVKIKGFNSKPSFKDFKEAFYKKIEIESDNIEWNKKDFLIKKINRKKKTNLFSLNKRTWNSDLKSTKPLYIV